MSNLKGKVSLFLVMIMMMTAVLPIFTVSAASEVTMTVKMGSTTMKAGKTYEVTGGEKINVTASSAAGIAFIGYRFVKNGTLGTITDEYSDSLTFTVPAGQVGTTIAVRIEAVANNDDGSSNTVTKTGWREYYLKYVSEEQDDPVVANKAVSASVDGTKLSTSKNNKVEIGEYVDLKATPSDSVVKLFYSWDDEATYEVSAATKSIVVPSRFAPGTTHTLYVTAKYTDGVISDWTKYTIVIPAEVVDEPVTPDEPEEEIDDELVVEDWMKESSELGSLSVSLRNESEEDKENKNIYELGEEVIYYIDYANGTSKDIDNAKLVFETELAFDVVDAFGGKVDGKTVTWEFPNGIEEEQTGTKVLVIKYTDLGKSKLESKVINPVADIYKGSKVADSSAVFNLIFKDVDVEITDDEHYPYMQGDAGKPTFRPDDGITRAEGALVLTRIFGMSTSGTTVTDVYSDLGETYLEAQKAIVAASAAGLINGYEDGTYKPNKKMTRAEFMKIIAANIELMAEEEDIRGLEVKSSEDEIKIYKNPTKSYVLGNTTVNEHWASSYVTFLARLNMTSVSSKEKDLRLDDSITRAEVAQLVNFYLLRAPAEDVKTTQFSDVSKNHKLFGDIVEATREAHTYYLTTEGTEIVD